MKEYRSKNKLMYTEMGYRQNGLPRNGNVEMATLRCPFPDISHCLVTCHVIYFVSSRWFCSILIKRNNHIETEKL